MSPHLSTKPTSTIMKREMNDMNDKEMLDAADRLTADQAKVDDHVRNVSNRNISIVEARESGMSWKDIFAITRMSRSNIHYNLRVQDSDLLVRLRDATRRQRENADSRISK